MALKRLASRLRKGDHGPLGTEVQVTKVLRGNDVECSGNDVFEGRGVKEDVGPSS